MTLYIVLSVVLFVTGLLLGCAVTMRAFPRILARMSWEQLQALAVRVDKERRD